jgi:hypothetical protein
MPIAAQRTIETDDETRRLRREGLKIRGGTLGDHSWAKRNEDVKKPSSRWVYMDRTTVSPFVRTHVS